MIQKELLGERASGVVEAGGGRRGKDAVAGDDDGDGVVSHGIAHSAGGCR